jgi:hypothetical protein
LPARNFRSRESDERGTGTDQDFQSKGVVIIVVGEAELKQLATGENFITMLRRKYEKVRLDLRKELL